MMGRNMARADKSETVWAVDRAGGVDTRHALSRKAATERAIKEQAAMDAVRAKGAVPRACGPEIPEAPARGPVQILRPVAQQVNDGGRIRKTGGVHKGSITKVDTGYKGRAVMRRLDAFGRMEAEAAKRGKPMPLTPEQVATGRLYAQLVERYEAGGYKCSSLSERVGGSGSTIDVTDARLMDREKILRMRKAIGDGIAVPVRKIRPSQRGTRVAITDRYLVDAICLSGMSFREVLLSCGWGYNARLIMQLRNALCEKIDLMA